MSDVFLCLACQGTYQDIQVDGSIYHHVCAPFSQEVAGAIVNRPNARDETITTNTQGNVTGIQSEGAGVKCLSDPQLLEPPWVKDLFIRIDREKAS